MKILALFCVIAFLLMLGTAFAHQPRIELGVNNSASNPIIIPDPEISKAYYGQLNGHPDYYEIISGVPFNLYLNILVPDIPVYNETRMSVEVTNITGDRIIFLDGTSSNWSVFYEPFGNDNYIRGPEASLNVSQGVYHIKVFNQNNSGRYSLATGETETFPASEILKTMVTVPILKVSFFNKPFYEIFTNIAGEADLASIVILIVIFFVIRRLTKRLKKKK
jgi:hypothetical protein